MVKKPKKGIAKVADNIKDKFEQICHDVLFTEYGLLNLIILAVLIAGWIMALVWL